MPSHEEISNLIINASGGILDGIPLNLYNPPSNLQATTENAHMIASSKQAILELQQLLVFGDQETRMKIINETPGGVLIHLAREIGSNNSLDVSRAGLFYLVPKIMGQPLSHQEDAFKRHTIQETNAFSGKIIEWDDPQKNNHYLDETEYGVAHLLYKLKVKANSLKDRNEIAAYEAANWLHEELHNSFLEYLANHEKINDVYEKFKTKWNGAIMNEKTAELKNHRGWKNFMANLALFIVTLGTVHAGAAIAEKITDQVYTGKHGLFSLTKTDSAQHVANLKQGVKKIEPKVS